MGFVEILFFLLRRKVSAAGGGGYRRKTNKKQKGGPKPSLTHACRGDAGVDDCVLRPRDAGVDDRDRRLSLERERESEERESLDRLSLDRLSLFRDRLVPDDDVDRVHDDDRLVPDDDFDRVHDDDRLVPDEDDDPPRRLRLGLRERDLPRAAAAASARSFCLNAAPSS